MPQALESLDGVLRASLIGTWRGRDSAEVYAEYDGGCYQTTRTFTFSAVFLEDGTFKGETEWEHTDLFGEAETGGRMFSGTWATTSAPLGIECRVNEQTYPDDDHAEQKLRPVVELRFHVANNQVEHVVIDDTNSEICHEAHCYDLHTIKCSKISELGA